MSVPLTPAQAEEVRRDRKIWTTLIVIGLLVTVVVLALGSGVIKGRLAAAKQLDAAKALLKESAPAFTAADAVVGADITSATVAQAGRVTSEFADLRPRFEDAIAQLDAGMQKFTDDEQRQAVLVQTAARTRIETIDAARPILSTVQQAAVAQGPAGEGWGRVLAADGIARQAVTDFNKQTKAGVESAAAANDSAAEGFSAGRVLLKEAAGTFPRGNLTAFVKYADARIAMVALSKRADTLWLAGDSAKSNALITTYNKKDAAAVALAKKLPGSPGAAIAEGYEAAVKQAKAAYVAARQRAAEADGELGAF